MPRSASGSPLAPLVAATATLLLACDPTLTPVAPPEAGDGGEIPVVRPSAVVVVVPTPMPTPTGSFPPFALDTVSAVVLGTGLGYTIIRQAPADAVAASPGTSVKVHYTGWLTSGVQFDSSRSRGAPFSFTLGQRRVIAGWEQGVAGMRVGEWRKLVIPPALGYGQAGTGKIPPGAILIFEVELLGL
ncbi:MAG: FKBP-type peptidyl-prolyl cis-trans isomerase [Candidatus Sericytochromatia bacterium]|nr:FKBP-type peptidyl-prolyl cis-trans isomerase [Candidatus Sericytochromatia bacterium]